MTIEFRCPSCQQKYSAPNSAAGKVTKCKKCGGAVTIPSPSAEWEELPTLETADEDSLLGEPLTLQPLPPMPSSPLSSLKPPSAPKKKGRLVRGFAASSLLGRVANYWLVLLVVGGLLLWIGYRELRLGALAKSTPQTLSLEQLANNGPGDNIYLDLTDVHMLLEQAVIKTERRNFGPERWTYAWIPAVSASSFGALQPSSVKVIVGTKQCYDDAKLGAFSMQSTLRGIIVNETDKLNSEERKLLSEGLPGIDFSTCYIFREGQGPGNLMATSLLLAGGSITFILGGVLAAFVFSGKVRN